MRCFTHFSCMKVSELQISIIYQISIIAGSLKSQLIGYFHGHIVCWEELEGSLWQFYDNFMITTCHYAPLCTTTCHYVPVLLTPCCSMTTTHHYAPVLLTPNLLILRHILRCFTHFSCMKVSELQISIIASPCLPLVAPSNHILSG